jgi:hypothetical protein
VEGGEQTSLEGREVEAMATGVKGVRMLTIGVLGDQASHLPKATDLPQLMTAGPTLVRVTARVVGSLGNRTRRRIVWKTTPMRLLGHNGRRSRLQRTPEEDPEKIKMGNDAKYKQQ